jgi:hypothetical protein
MAKDKDKAKDAEHQEPETQVVADDLVAHEEKKPHGQQEAPEIARDQYGYPLQDSAGNVLKRDGQPLTGLSDDELERIKKQKL